MTELKEKELLKAAADLATAMQTGIFTGRTQIVYSYGCYGYTRGGGATWHGGLDLVGLDDAFIRMPYYNGTKPIRGTVTRARIVTDHSDKTWEWGWYICVQLDAAQTPDEVNFLYFCHCKELLVKVGQKVKSGDALAIMGNTGNAAYNVPPYKHCHLEVRATATGRGLNPTAYSGTDNAAGTYGNTAPLPAPANGRLQIITVGPVTQGDADAILLTCEARGLTDAGLYVSKWANEEKTLQTIKVGPVSQGDADAILATAHARELDKQGLYRSVWADEQEG